MPLAPLIGRDDEMRTLLNMLRQDDVRLITIVGPGGVGKTRLALEAAREVERHFGGGSHVIRFGETAASTLVSQMLASGLVDKTDPTSPNGAEALTGLRTLLLIDTFEHLLEAASLLGDLLETHPELTALVTSRAPLRLSGEHVLRLHGLEVPSQHPSVTMEAIRAVAGVRMFLEQVHANDAAVVIADEDVPVISRICAELDGNPLAIELAAAQVVAIPPSTLLARIANDLPLPLPGQRGRTGHHETIQDTIRWSYSLLPHAAKEILRRASVFEGGFELDALGTVLEICGTTTRHDDGNVVKGLGTLVDHHLVQPVSDDFGGRFTMLHTIRRFARSELEAAGETCATRAAHARWCLLRVRSLELGSPPDLRPERELSRLERELPNLTRALEWFESRGDRPHLLELAACMRPVWQGHALVREGERWLRKAIELPGAGEPVIEGRARVYLGLFHSYSGKLLEAEQIMESGLALIEPHDDPGMRVAALVWLGMIATRSDRFGRAETLLDQAMEIVMSLPDTALSRALKAGTMSNLGVVMLARGDLDAAEHWHMQSLAIHEVSGMSSGVMHAQADLAEVARDRGDFRTACSRYQAALRAMLPIREAEIVINALEGTALALLHWRQPQLAAAFLGAARSISQQRGILAAAAPERATRLRALAAVNASLPQVDLDAAWREGASWTIDEAIQAVLALEIPDGASVAMPLPGPHLTRRERDVLALLAEGMSDQEIADRLFLGVRTIESHMHNLRAKFGVTSRGGVLSAAYASGLLVPEAANSLHSPDET